jgi:selenocysteine-specific elongation factor
VVRRLSPKDLLGGGTIGAGVAPAQSGEDALDPDEQTVAGVLNSFGIASGIPTTIAARANLREERTTAILESFVERGLARKLAKPIAFVDASSADKLYSRAILSVNEAHRESPWKMGLTSIALSKRLEAQENILVRILATYVDEGRLEYRNGYYAAPGFAPELIAAQRQFFDAAVQLDPQNPLIPVGFDDLSSALRTTKVYRGTQIAEARARVEGILRKEGTMTMARFRDVIGTSRKYAVPLLEWFDAAGITIRNGDIRTLRAG